MIGHIKKIGADIMFHSIQHANVHDCIALLNDNEVDVNCTNINGQTPLHYAVQAENHTIIKVLLDRGANPEIQALDCVGSNNPMHIAAEKNLITVLEWFIAAGGDVTIQNKQGFNCLHIAAREGHTDLCKFLLATGIDPDIRDKSGFSASYWAHQNKFTDICTILPPPLKWTKEDIYEHMKQVWASTGFAPGGKGKKKKGKGKKKK